jgi:hypothetical protein
LKAYHQFEKLDTRVAYFVKCCISSATIFQNSFGNCADE